MNQLIDLNLVIQDVLKEVRGSRKKYPDNEDKLAVLFEEVGELSQAMINHKHGCGSMQQVYNEAIQSAASAIRVAIEGSAEFKYRFSESHSANFRPTKADIKRL